MTAPDVLLQTPVPPAGTVSSACRFLDQEGVRLVLIHGVQSYLYDPQDKPTHRLIWVMIHLHGHAQQEQISRATGISRHAFAVLG